METLNFQPERPSISQVENAFQPAREMTDPELFAGRREAVQQAYYGLIGEGAHIAVVGNRGIGKTSLARQILMTWPRGILSFYKSSSSPTTASSTS